MTAALLLVLVACASPWAFGAVEPYWWSIAAGSCLVIAAGSFAVRALGRGDDTRLPPVATRLAIALPALALAGLLPIPMAVREILSPAAARVLAAADPAAATGWRPISLDPHGTLVAACVAAACAATFWIVAASSLDARRARVLTGLFLASGALLAAFGLWHRLAHYDPRAVFWGSWRVELPDEATPFGPYVNRNHFAGAMELVTGVAAGSALAAFESRRRAAGVLCAAVGALAAVAAIVTMSRGGLIGLAAGAVVLVAAAGGRTRRRVALAAVAVIAVTIAVLWATGLLEDLAGRFEVSSEGRWKNRFAVQWDAVRVFAGNPVLGTGAGSFEAAYPPFQSVADVRFFNNAHSDWAQFLMETAIAGVVFVVLAVREIVPRGVRAATTRAPSRWLCLGPLAGCASVAAHGFFDVNLHVPANALLFAVALSLAYAAAVRDST